MSPRTLTCLSHSLVTEPKSTAVLKDFPPRMVFPVVLFPLPVLPSKRRRTMFSLTEWHLVLCFTLHLILLTIHELVWCICVHVCVIECVCVVVVVVT